MKLPPIEGFGFIAEISRSKDVASSLYIQGCNLRCHYCINRSLLSCKGDLVDPDFIIQRFQFRREKIIVLSGGEPMMHEETMNLCSLLKRNGFKVALATNGTFPERIKDAAEYGIIDHVIMDIKTELKKERYDQVVGKKLSYEEFDNILEMIDYLLYGPFYKPSCEFRTTVCSKFVSEEDLFSIAKNIGMGSDYVLQPFTTHQTLSPELSNEKYVVPFEDLKILARKIAPFVASCVVREV